MRLLEKLARWWWRWLLTTISLLGMALLGVIVASIAGWVPQPSVLRLTPLAGSRELPPATALEFNFNLPMDRSSVEDALVITPPVRGRWHWEGRSRARWQPEFGWTPGTTVTVQLRPTAQSMLRQTLATTVTTQFAAAPAPLLVFRSPLPNAIIAPNTPILLRFNRAMIDYANQTERGLAELSIEPNAASQVRWLDDRSVLVQVQWQVGQQYQLKLQNLNDLLGIPVQTTEWQVQVSEPNLIAPPTAQTLQADQAVEWAFEGLLDQTTTQQLIKRIQFTPAVSTTWQVRYQPEPQPQTIIQVLPAPVWPTGQALTTSLQLSQPITQVWQIQSNLQLIGSVPGRGGSLAVDDPLRLLFNQTPERQQLAEQLLIEPEVANVAININNQQALISAAWQPSTVYTLTLAGSAPLTFRTQTQAQPLQIEGVGYSLLLPETTAELRLSGRENSRLTASLYVVDRAVLAAALQQPQTPLNPQRYNLQPQQQWQIAAGPERTISITPTQAALLLQVQAPNTELVQHVLIWTPYRAQLLATPEQAQAWIVDLANRQPVAAADLSILAGANQLATGQSDSQGLWQTAIQGSSGRLVLLGGEPQAPIVAETIIRPQRQAPSLSSQLLLDRQSYQANQQLTIIGSSEFATDLVTTPTLTLAVLDPSGQAIAPEQTLVVSQSLWTTKVQLAADVQPGLYQVRLRYANQVIASQNFVVNQPNLVYRVVLPEVQATNAIVPAEIISDLPNQHGLWRLLDQRNRQVTAGSWYSNAAGIAQFDYQQSQTLLGDYVLEVQLGEQVSYHPSQIRYVAQLAAKAEQQLLNPNQPTNISFQLRDQQGMALANRALQIEVQGAITSTQSLRTNAAGEVIWRTNGLRSGLWLIRASSPDAASVEVPLWVLGVTTEQAIGRSQSNLVETAELALAPLTNLAATSVLVSWFEGGTLRQQIQPWVAGQRIAITPSLSNTQQLEVALAWLDAEQLISSSSQIPFQAVAPLDLTMVVSGSQLVLATQRAGRPVSSMIGLSFQSIQMSASQQRLVRTASNGQAVLDLQGFGEGWQIQALASDGLNSAEATTLFSPNPLIDVQMLLPERLIVGDQLSVTARLNLLATRGGIPTIRLSVDSTDLAALTEPTTGNSGRIYTTTQTLVATNLGTTTLTATIEVNQQTQIITKALTIQPPSQVRLQQSRLLTEATDITWQVPMANQSASINIAIASLAQASQALPSQLQGDDPLTLAGRIAMARYTAQPAHAEIELLAKQQLANGSWSWDAQAGDLQLTALIVQLIASEQRSPQLRQLEEQATRWLALVSPLDPDLRSEMLLALAQSGKTVEAQITSLLKNRQLTTAQRLRLIYGLVLLDSPQADQYLLEVRQMLAQPLEPSVWMSRTRQAALIGLIFERSQPSSALRAQVLNSIAEGWNGATWEDLPSSVAVFQLTQQDFPTRGNYRLGLNGTTLSDYDQASSLSLPITNQLNLQIEPNGPILLASQASWQNPAAQAHLLHSSSDDQLVYGEQWLWQGYLVLEHDLPSLQLRLATPRGVEWQLGSATGLNWHDGQFSAANVRAGIYPIQLLGVARHKGQFAWPAPQLTSGGQIIELEQTAPSVLIR
ncbi:Ig-like domain-containing protein [Herpetosiphon gulosus]|uniref:Bacterial Ig domain-containing protein n=1 Tax=Herpetosiphon gulosus TaxID=1973496 RepID=A0ABP9X398_9CHLR